MAKASLLILKLLLILVSTGWVCLWILKPTQVWTRTWKAAEEKASASVFGYNGLCFAVYTFPVIGFAIVGFVYLEQKKQKQKQKQKQEEGISRQERRCLAFLSNPLIVKSSLGILSGIEILGVSLFIIFLAWTFYTRISNDFRKTVQIKDFKLAVWQYRMLRVATRFGLLTEACLALLLLPVLRRMAVFRLVGLQFEVSVRYHTWLGTAMIVFATLHGAATFFIWGIKHHIHQEMWRWQKVGRIYLAGEITLVTGLIIWVTSLPQIRRKCFEVFYYTHHLYIVFLVFFLFHGGDRHFYMVFPGIFLFAIDKLLRIIESRPHTRILSARIFPSKAIELILPKDPRLKYTPTSVIFVKIPSISEFQWHPFSLTSSSSVDDHTMSIMIKCEGWWGSSLYNLITSAPTDSEADQPLPIPVAVEGPYGPATLEFLRYNSLVLVAGGIGITPILSILQEIASGDRNVFPGRVEIIFATKRSQDVCMLNPVLSRLLDSKLRIHLKLKVYVTQEKQTNQTLLEMLDHEVSVTQLRNFESKFSGYLPYGPENLYWMAALAATASILFMLFLASFNHVFLHTGKKSSKDKTPSSLIDLFLLCSFAMALVCVALIAAVRRWKCLRKDMLPLADKESIALKPRLTETNRSHDQELEIHFGARPNFQDIFAEFTNESRGSYTGVFICGPESMKESVALACQLSSQACKPQFSFHSLNFSL